jgi:Galactosyltransferase
MSKKDMYRGKSGSKPKTKALVRLKWGPRFMAALMLYLAATPWYWDLAEPPQYDHYLNAMLSAFISPAKPKVRYLFGIFTSNGEKEMIRRRVIRSTYLSFYKQQYVGSPQGTSNDNVICSIQELQQDYQHKFQDCQIVYTFVAAAGDPHSAPTERMHHNHTHPFTLQSAPGHSNMSFWFKNETDITYLNIKENMNEGKSQTWFKYGVMVAAQLGIDYIVKLDSDAVVWPSCFLSQMEQNKVSKVLDSPHGNNNNVHNNNQDDNMMIPYKPNKTSLYAGFSWDFTCYGQHEFYSGMFYFMSTDVAHDVTSDACPRHHLLYSPARLRQHGCPEETVVAFEGNPSTYA